MLEVEQNKEVSAKDNSVIQPMVEMDHEQVVFCQDKATGLKAIIAIHNTVLGPSLGGTRMWAYSSEQEALNDVLRLSRGMTYKSAISGLNLGGGKAVIIGDSRTQKTEAMFRRFGRFVDSLGGKYITAEDVGVTTRDIEWVHMETEHVAGLPEYRGGGGDPSPVTAYGVYMGIKAAVKHQSGSESLTGKKILVQGVGNVGRNLVDLLVKEGAKVAISDIHQDKLTAVTSNHGVEVVSPEDVFDYDMDVYSPCALGATINDENLAKLKCSVIAGAANNQLANEKVHGAAVKAKGIIYAPDFLINAGGIINCYSETLGYNRDLAYSQTENIYNTALEIFKLSASENIPTYLAANNMAESRIAQIAEINKRF